MKCHKSFRKNIRTKNAYILKITTDLVGKKWLKFGQQKWLVSEVLCNGHRKYWYFFTH